jgi:hypothetical protein
VAGLVHGQAVEHEFQRADQRHHQTRRHRGAAMPKQQSFVRNLEQRRQRVELWPGRRQRSSERPERRLWNHGMQQGVGPGPGQQADQGGRQPGIQAGQSQDDSHREQPHRHRGRLDLPHGRPATGLQQADGPAEEKRQQGQQGQQRHAVHEAGQHRLRHELGKTHQPRQAEHDLERAHADDRHCHQRQQERHCGGAPGRERRVGGDLRHQGTQHQHRRSGRAAGGHGPAREQREHGTADGAGHQRSRDAQRCRLRAERREGEQAHRQRRGQADQRAGDAGLELAPREGQTRRRCVGAAR